jgi:cell division protein FtsW (lipid II flippase)
LRDKLSLTVCSGLFAVLAGNTIVNLGVVAGILPTKGLPLPFVSAGGTSYIVSMFAIGIFGQAYHRFQTEGERTLT